MNANPLSLLPSVDKLLGEAHDLIIQYGRENVVRTLRDVLEDTRARLLVGEHIDLDTLLDRTSYVLETEFSPTLRAVINATGVIIHTNLGRAPLSNSAQQAITEVAAQYNTLEYDLDNGKRGSRLLHAGEILRQVTGAEAALVVNNNAAATVLMLAELAQGREVIVSRGQLVEIGGGFRVPDIMRQSGAQLVEVGTTNRTRASDYEKAVTGNTALLLRVHSSNFKQIGFTEETPLAEMAAITKRHGLFLGDDLGSGSLIDTAQFGLDHEPTVQESISAGADIIAFSGDKLLGGPQAGILVGKKAVIDRLKQHPLARAMRADKLCLAALYATLDHYRRGDATQQIPIWRMISRPLEDIRQMAEQWAARLGAQAEIITGESTVGGGSLPGSTLPTWLLSLQVSQPDIFMVRLRSAPIPIIARISSDRVLFDPRTVLPSHEEALLHTLVKLMQ